MDFFNALEIKNDDFLDIQDNQENDDESINNNQFNEILFETKELGDTISIGKNELSEINKTTDVKLYENDRIMSILNHQSNIFDEWGKFDVVSSSINIHQENEQIINDDDSNYVLNTNKRHNFITHQNDFDNEIENDNDVDEEEQVHIMESQLKSKFSNKCFIMKNVELNAFLKTVKSHTIELIDIHKITYDAFVYILVNFSSLKFINIQHVEQFVSFDYIYFIFYYIY